MPAISRIAIGANGDPRSPRTWSGTAANLCRAFEAAGVEVESINFAAALSRNVERALRIAGKIYYLNSRYVRLGRIESAWRARHAAALVEKAGDIRHMIHCQAFSCPLTDVSRHHSIVLDTTWHLWHKFSTDVFDVSPRLYRDGLEAERSLLHAANHCFPLSEYARTDLIDHYGVPPERITVIGTGRGALQPYHGPKDYQNGSILFVAKERFADKGGHQLVEAFRVARRENPQLNLTIVGRPEYESMFAGIEGVRGHGHVPLETLQRLFNEASLFAMPARFEPWGLVYLEALACRTPVLGLSDHALPEITRNGRYGFCLTDGSAGEIAKALVTAFAAPERLARMGAEGQEHCLAHFTWEATVQRIVNALTAT